MWVPMSFGLISRPENITIASGLMEDMVAINIDIPWAANLHGIVGSAASLVPIAQIIKE
jgi:hypothetical protein